MLGFARKKENTLALTKILAVALTIMLAACAQQTTVAPDKASAVVEVVIETTLGDIEIALYTDKAPVSAGEFVKYVDQGLFNEAFFYRVVTKANDNAVPGIEIVQGGLDPAKAATMPGIIHETTEQTGILHKDGVLSLARFAPGTATPGAFFICIGDNPGLDFGGARFPDGQGGAAFGKVTSGMEVVRAIHQMEANYPVDFEQVKRQILTEPVAFTKVYRKAH